MEQEDTNPPEESAPASPSGNPEEATPAENPEEITPAENQEEVTPAENPDAPVAAASPIDEAAPTSQTDNPEDIPPAENLEEAIIASSPLQDEATTDIPVQDEAADNTLASGEVTPQPENDEAGLTPRSEVALSPQEDVVSPRNADELDAGESGAEEQLDTEILAPSPGGGNEDPDLHSQKLQVDGPSSSDAELADVPKMVQKQSEGEFHSHISEYDFDAEKDILVKSTSASDPHKPATTQEVLTNLMDELLQSTNEMVGQEGHEIPELPPLEKIQTNKQALSALLPVWSFGINRSLPVINLSSENRHVIFYTCANLGIMYDYKENEQRILQGHANNITCTYASVDRRWLVTGDSGPQSSLVIWDSLSGGIVRVMHEPHPHGVVGVALTPDARYLATLGAADPSNGMAQTFAVWDWTTGEEAPLCSALLSSTEYGVQTYIYFNPQNTHHIVTNSESQVLFFQWSQQGIEYYAPPLTDQDFNKPVGKFSQSIYQPNTTRALTATSQGLCVVWDTNKSLVKVSKELSADMKAVKLVPLHERGINVLMLTEKFIVTADVAGHLKFFDYNLMLIYWYQHFTFGPINSVGFRYYPRLALKDDATRNTTYPTDATIPQEKFVVRDLIVGTSTSVVVKMSPTDGEIHVILREFDNVVDALACHPKLPRVAIGGYSGLLKIWNYNAMKVEVSRYFKKPTKITCCAFDASGSFLALGFSNGYLRVLDSLTLSDVMPEPITYARMAITHVAFSLDSNYLAAVDAERTTTLLRATPAQDPQTGNHYVSWGYIGRYRAHTQPVVDMKFGQNPENNQPQLVTLGLDRRLVEYDVVNSEKDNLKLLSVNKIEQSSNPLLVCWYPPLGKERFLCTANDQYKIKLYNITTKMCRKTLLGPTYGSTLRKMEVLPVLRDEPETERRYLCFVNQDKVGLIKLPITGNPHNNIAFVAHPSGVSNMACSFDGRFIFTAGGKDSVVHMWIVNRDVLDAQSLLGGTGVAPFCELLEGGRNGLLYKELEDYFYYAQIRSQGINTMDTRNVSTTIPLAEIPYVMRAMGFYPTEEEIEDILNEVKFTDYVETGQYVTSVDIGQFVQLYVNHRPPFGISSDRIRDAFKTLCAMANNDQGDEEGKKGLITREFLLSLLQTKGEHIMEYELAEYLTTLMGLNPEGGSIEELEFDATTAVEQIDTKLPEALSADMFIADILGLGPLTKDPSSTEENESAGKEPAHRSHSAISGVSADSTRLPARSISSAISCQTD